ncbi:hypothetical protein Hypma_004084 [Hypsizygus marmoreus]|uniref:Uncharacterized protein n=1 Tax=Hypsizygus marmoreus TaxID=39966 RepID=A0A369K472_HYPMA|nr:hypothetical protein Hypma_004084 [Hypsizygus marmoreus]
MCILPPELRYLQSRPGLHLITTLSSMPATCMQRGRSCRKFTRHQERKTPSRKRTNIYNKRVGMLNQRIHGTCPSSRSPSIKQPLMALDAPNTAETCAHPGRGGFVDRISHVEDDSG